MSRSGAANTPGAPMSPQASCSRDPQPTTSHTPDAHVLQARLTEYLQLEGKFQPRLCLPSEDPQEVTTSTRDGAAHVIRSLKVWFDLPPDVLFHAVNLFDRFLTKMRVRPCHVPCITVACINIATEEYATQKGEERKVSIEDLVAVSQSACTVRDVERMSRVIEDKLSLCRGATAALTSLNWLRLFKDICSACELDTVEESSLTNALEMVACSHQCANLRAPATALALLQGVSSGPVLDVLAALQSACSLTEQAIQLAGMAVHTVVSRYEQRTRAQAPPQRLVWNLSERTLRALRPTTRLTSRLPTIAEQHYPYHHPY